VVVLWITWERVWPASSGGKIREYNLIKRLLANGNEVEVWRAGNQEPLEWPGPPPARLRVRDFGPRVRQASPARTALSLVSRYPEIAWSMRSDWALAAARAIFPDEFDVCLLSHSDSGALLQELKRSATPLVLDAQNVEWQVMEQIVSLHPRLRTRLRTRLDAIKLRRLELRLVPAVDAVIAVSEEDRSVLTSYGPRRPIAIHPNGVDLAYFAFGDHTEPQDSSLLMTGSMSYPPNLDACRWISQEVMPAVRARLPSAAVRLVGGPLTPEVEAMDDPARGIEVVGPVPDMRPYYREADVFLIAMRAGGGTRIKALEALATGVPIVSTAVGVAGLGLVPGRHVLIAETAEHIAEAVALALTNTELRHHLGREGRRLVETKFNWDRIAVGFERTIAEVVVESRASRVRKVV
jgi:glycosyltransferase involved in cell wall biosynthesis